MAGATTYTDPSAYLTEVVTPGGLNIPALPFAVCLVGTGSRNKRVVNEPVVRGIVKGESLTVDPTPGSHTATLANRSDRSLDSTTVYKILNGITTIIPDQYVGFNPAYVQGTVAGTVDLTSNNAIALEMDGIPSVTLVFYPATGAKATGSITAIAKASLTDGEKFVLNDGVNPAVTFWIDKSGSFVPPGGYNATNIDLNISADTSAATVAATIQTVINGVGGGLAITAGVPVGAVVPLTNDAFSAAGNIAITDTVDTAGFSHTGMSGGVNPGPSVARIGRQINISATFGTLSAATMTEIASAINLGLGDSGSTVLGYGPAYALAASVVTGFLRLTSQAVQPDNTSVGATNSDVRVFAPDADSATLNIFGASSLDAPTALLINDLVWSSSATWKADYVELVGNTDPLAQTSNIQRIVSIGSSRGGTNFAPMVDWLLTSNQVDWSPDTSAVVNGVATAGTFDLSVNDLLVLGFDGLVNAFDTSTTDITVDLVDMTNPPIGYISNPGSTLEDGDASTLANIATNINAVMAAALGPRYKNVASVVAGAGSTFLIRLTSPLQGSAASSIYVKAAPSNSANVILFNGSPTALGTGKRPAVGSAYYVTYEFTRPNSGPLNEYGVPFQHFSLESALAQVGNVSPSTAGFNPLAISAQIAFENGSQIIYTVQVDDTAEGNPTRSQVRSALDGAKITAGITEVIVVGEPGTRVDVVTDMIDHLETECSSTEKHPRRIFNGMLSNTPIGDSGTANSIVGRATRTLQVSPSSPGRGRMFLIAPPQQAGVTRTVTFEDGSTARIALDATYMGVAVAAKRTALAGPAETLTRKTITGFNTDDITQAWKPAERRAMAGQGTLVITFDAGRFLMLDAMSTENGGGGLEQFAVDSTSYQKDVVVTKVTQALDDNVIGIVPFDLATFLLDIKLIIQGVIAKEINNGTIGPFRDSAGNIRAIDLRTDIRVAQNPNVQTEYDLAFFFNLRYPALRIFGSYSVDAQFASLVA